MAGSGAIPVQKPVDTTANCALLDDDSLAKCAVIAPKKTEKPDGFVKAERRTSHSKENPSASVTWMATAARRFGGNKETKDTPMSTEQFDRVKGEPGNYKLNSEVRGKDGLKKVSISFEGAYFVTFGELARGPKGPPEGLGLHAVPQTNGIFYLNDSQFATYQQKIAEARGESQIKRSPSAAPVRTSVADKMITKGERAKGKSLYTQSVGSLKPLASPKGDSTSAKSKADEDFNRRLNQTLYGKSPSKGGSPATSGESWLNPFSSEKVNPFRGQKIEDK